MKENKVALKEPRAERRLMRWHLKTMKSDRNLSGNRDIVKAAMIAIDDVLRRGAHPDVKLVMQVRHKLTRRLD